jgi:hypothetical protein
VSSALEHYAEAERYVGMAAADVHNAELAEKAGDEQVEGRANQAFTQHQRLAETHALLSLAAQGFPTCNACHSPIGPSGRCWDCEGNDDGSPF